jgi:hypothetical protein
LLEDYACANPTRLVADHDFGIVGYEYYYSL